MKKVFFGSNNSINEKFFMDVKEDTEIEYCDFYEKLNSKIKKFFFKQKVLKLMPFSLKKIIFRKVLNYDFLKNSGKGYLFVFCNSYELFGDPQFVLFLKFLKRNFKNSKFAFYYYDVIASCYPEQFAFLKKEFDFILTFNRFCADKYNVEFYGPICENIIEPPMSQGEESDIFYAANVNGGAHDDHYRLDLIMDVFKYATDNNRKCIFYLNRTKESDLKFIRDLLPSCILSKDLKNLQYKQSTIVFEYSSYYKSLAYIDKCKCMLEIVLPANYAMCTARLAQAMVRHKKLLTNCIDIKNEKFYNSNNILIFDKLEDIDFNDIDLPFEKVNHNFSGKALIDHIENELCK